MAEARGAFIIALDVGGSSVKSAVLAGPGRLASEIVQTPIDSAGPAEPLIGALAGIVRGHLSELAAKPVVGVALGFPGPFDYATGRCLIRGVGKFEALFGLNVGAALQAALGRPDLAVRFRNDAEAAVLGEARYGAGRPFGRLIGLTLGTGCGSAFIAGGVPVTEGPGVPPGGWVYPLPVAGQRADDVFSTRGMLARLAAKRVGAPSIPAAALAARQGAAEAQHVFAAYGAELGAFMAPLVTDFQAEALLVLGGLAATFDLFGPALAQALPVPALPPLLGARAALFGAGDLY